MSVYSRIIELWKLNSALNTLLPGTSVVVGQQHETDNALSQLPYAVLINVSDVRQGRSSEADFFDEVIQVSIFHTTYEKARKARDACRQMFRELATNTVAMISLLEGADALSIYRENGGILVEDGRTVHAFDTYVIQRKETR